MNHARLYVFVSLFVCLNACQTKPSTDLSDGLGRDDVASSDNTLQRHGRRPPALELVEGDSFSNCVRRAGDTMNGPLKFTTSAAGDPTPIQLLPGQQICWCADARCILANASCLTFSGGSFGAGDGGTGFVHITGDTMTGTLDGRNVMFISSPASSGQISLDESTGAELKYGLTQLVCNGTSCTFTANGSTFAFTTNGNLTLSSTPGFRITGVATGSLPSASSSTRGNINYDTTIGRLVLDDNRGGSDAHRYVLTSDTGTSVAIEESYVSLTTATPSAEGATYLDGYTNNGNAAGTAQNITCSFGTAGVTGGATTGVVMQVWDVTGAAEVCHCTIANAAGCALTGLFTCTCSGNMATGRSFGVRMSATTDCGTDPGNVYCNVAFTKSLTASMAP